MPLHAGPRLHAFLHGLLRPSDLALTRELYERVERQFARYGLGTEAGRERLIGELAARIADVLGLSEHHPQRGRIAAFVSAIFEYEALFRLPQVDWSERLSVTEYWQIRDELTAQRQLVETFEPSCVALVACLVNCLDPLYADCPWLREGQAREGDIVVPSDLIHSLHEVGDVTEAITAAVFDERLEERGLFHRHRARLERNLVAASGGNPADRRNFTRALKLPGASDIKDPAHLVATYLGGTPLADLFRQEIEIAIPTAVRFEHQHIVAGSGHGKTQTLQYLIARDLEAIACGGRSVVVLDSQGDLIANVARLAVFAPGGSLHDRIVIIDPTDVEWPVSLNLFDVGLDRLSGCAPLERERLTNSILELYDFVLGSLLAAEMTQKQSVIFRYVTRLMLHIPDATIHTLRALMEPGSHVAFAPHIAKLQGTARQFFETEFPSKEFEQTKKQVLRRPSGARRFVLY